MKIRIQEQGKIVVEREKDGLGYLMMYPDGQVVHRSSRAGVEHFAKLWFKDHVDPDSAGIGTIEWRL